MNVFIRLNVWDLLKPDLLLRLLIADIIRGSINDLHYGPNLAFAYHTAPPGY